MKQAARLPMYDFVEVRDATVGLWTELRDAARAVGLDAPDTLDAEGDSLFLGQVCGIEVASDPKFPHALVGTPVYEFAGCVGSNHRAFVVTREDDRRSLDDLQGRGAAVNEPGSNTGSNLFADAIGEPLDAHFKQVTVTGAHRDSLRAVQAGDADVASIDCVTFGLLARHAPDAVAGLRVLTQTRAVPAPPFVSDHRGDSLALLRGVVAEVVDTSANAATLGLRAVEQRDRSDYDIILGA